MICLGRREKIIRDSIKQKSAVIKILKEEEDWFLKILRFFSIVPKQRHMEEQLLLYTALEYSHYNRSIKIISENIRDTITWLGLNYTKDYPLYMISVYVPPFIMGVHSRYYYFKGTTIGTNLLFLDQTSVQIVSPPSVLNLPYKHPFVYHDGRICYGSLNWSLEKGVRFNYFYHYNSHNIRELGGRIAGILREGKEKLEMGYFGSKILPVYNLDKFTPIAFSRNGAIEYATRYNIGLERIIMNDT